MNAYYTTASSSSYEAARYEETIPWYCRDEEEPTNKE